MLSFISLYFALLGVYVFLLFYPKKRYKGKQKRRSQRQKKQVNRNQYQSTSTAASASTSTSTWIQQGTKLKWPTNLTGWLTFFPSGGGGGGGWTGGMTAQVWRWRMRYWLWFDKWVNDAAEMMNNKRWWWWWTMMMMKLASTSSLFRLASSFWIIDSIVSFISILIV